jgi:FMN phosphatase YigB (HAD superfamily)
VKLKAIVFDLDDTLLDTTNLLLPIAESEAFLQRINRPLPLMPGALANLVELQRKPEKPVLFLVTWGRTQLQQKKINSLGVSPFFDACFILGSSDWPDKATGFKVRVIPELEKIASPLQTLSIGNRITTDLRPAKEWGALTCHFAYGEHQNENLDSPFDKADFTVSNHFELARLLR